MKNLSKRKKTKWKVAPRETKVKESKWIKELRKKILEVINQENEAIKMSPEKAEELAEEYVELVKKQREKEEW